MSSSTGNNAASVEREIGQIARGAGVGLSGNIIFYGVSYLFGILVARQIGAENYGLYTLGVTVVTLISRITIAGLDRGMLRYASISRGEKQGATLHRVITLALAAGGVLGLLGGLFVWLYPEVVLQLLRWSDKQTLLYLLPVLAITIPALTITGIAIAGTVAFRTMRYRTLVTNIIQPIVKLVVALVLILGFGLDVMAPVLGFVVAQVLGSLLALFFLTRLGRSMPVDRGSTAHVGRKLARFSTPLLFANVVEYLNGRTELFVLAIFLAADVAGIFNAALRLAGLGLIVLTAFNAIFSPVISDLHHRREMPRLATLFKLVTRWIVAVAMPIFLAQMLFAPQIMGLFGPEFVAGAIAFRILSLGQMINIFTGSVGNVLMMSGRSDITLFNSVMTVVIGLALDFWLVPRLGLTGAAIAGMVVIVLANLARLLEVWMLLHMHPFSKAYLKPFVAAIAGTAAGLIWLRWLPLTNVFYLAIACLIVGVAYLVVMLALGLDEGDRIVIATFRQRFQNVATKLKIPAGKA